jgi:glycosyl hydrolase family 43
VRNACRMTIVTLCLVTLAACTAKQQAMTGAGGRGGGGGASLAGGRAGIGGWSGSAGASGGEGGATGGASGAGIARGTGADGSAAGIGGQGAGGGPSGSGAGNDGGAGAGGTAGPGGSVAQTGTAGTGPGGTVGSDASAGSTGLTGKDAGASPDAVAACTGPNGQVRYSGNPFVKRFVADPAAHVFNGRVYVYDTDDQTNDGTYWNSTVWHGYSSANLVDWTDEGTILSVKAFTWAVGWSAWAPDVVFKNGKYYFFGPIDDVHIGVAVGSTPTGPFTDAIGAPLIDKTRDANAGAEPIDPAVLIDDDGQAYLYFGTRVPKAVKLTADLLHMDGPILDMSVSGNNYGEAPWMGKHNGVYYFSYSTGWPGQIAYGTSTTPLGPFTFKGIVLDFVGIQTNHESIVENFKGQSYIFYHNAKLPGGGDFRRSIDVDELHYDPNGAIVQVVQTTTGVACVP